MRIVTALDSKSIIRLGEQATSVVYVESQPIQNTVQWNGDDSFVKTQSTAINGGVIDETTAGTAGRIHLLQRVYDPAVESSTSFCVTADSFDANGISHVDVFYGGSTPYRQLDRTTRGGIAGYWFDLEHDATASIEERTIYAEIVPVNSEVIPRVVSKKIRVGTPTYVDLDPADCLANGLHNRIKLDPGASNDNYVYRLSSGVYYLEQENVAPANLPNQEVWVEVKAASGADVEVRLVQSIPGSDYSYVRRDYDFIRVNHLVLRDLTWNMWEYPWVQIWGPYSNTDGTITIDVVGYLAFDGCTIIDPQSTDGIAPAGLINRGRIDGSTAVNWYAQNLFKYRTAGEEYYTELHNCKIRALTPGGAHEYLNCESCCEWDVFMWGRPVDGMAVNRYRNVLPYAPNNNTPDLETLRFFTSETGTRNGFYVDNDYTEDYAYSLSDLSSIQEMTYQVTGTVDKTNPKEFIVTLDQAPTKLPIRYVYGSGWISDTKFYDFSLYKWSSGDALTLGNRKFLEKPDGQGSLVITWLEDDDVDTSVPVNKLKFYRTKDSGDPERPDVESNGFVFDDHFPLAVGDRVSVIYWNHPDIFQTTANNKSNNIVVHDLVSVFDQQMLFQSGGNALDVIFNSCLFLEPDLGTSDFYFQIQEPAHSRIAYKWCTFDDYLLNIETDKLNRQNTNINVLASIVHNIEGESDTVLSDEWTGVQVIDSAYKELNYFDAGIGSLNGSVIYSGTSLDLDDYGVVDSEGAIAMTSSAQRLPIGVDGGSRSGQIGAVSAADASFVPSIDPVFRIFPSASEFNSTAGETVSVVAGSIESWGAVVPSAAYQWWTEDGEISGSTSESFDTTGRAGDRLWCLVSHGPLKHWVDFGTVQTT